MSYSWESDVNGVPALSSPDPGRATFALLPAGTSRTPTVKIAKVALVHGRYGLFTRYAHRSWPPIPSPLYRRINGSHIVMSSHYSIHA
jgi:hypothetical protein